MEVVVLDFETTGLSCDRHRVIEIGAVILNKEGEVINTFQTLCNPPLVKKLPNTIIKLTGITDNMLIGQPSTASAMESLYKFVGNRPIIAHNASFDSRFLIAEMKRINRTIFNQFLCTLLISRRLLITAQSYKLSRLKEFINFKADINHKDHRALDDVLVTVALWNHLLAQLFSTHGMPISLYSFDFMKTISRLPIKQVAAFLSKAVGNDHEADSIKPPPAKKDSDKADGKSNIVAPCDNIQRYFAKGSHESADEGVSKIVDEHASEIVDEHVSEIVDEHVSETVDEHVSETVDEHVSEIVGEDVSKETDLKEMSKPEALVTQERERHLILPATTPRIIENTVCHSPAKISSVKFLLLGSSPRLPSPLGTGDAEHDLKLKQEVDSRIVDENVNPAKRRTIRHSNPF
jgi:DNA polymerase III subunit epsilon